MKSYTQLSVRVDPQLKRKFTREVRRREESIQKAVAEAIDLWLKEPSREHQPAE